MSAPSEKTLVLIALLIGWCVATAIAFPKLRPLLGLAAFLALLFARMLVALAFHA